VLAAAFQVSKDGEVAVAFGPALGGGPGLTVTVTDAGPPLAEGGNPALFVPFGGVGPRTARQFGGTGLGLSIAWALAQLLGGDLAAEPAGATGCRYVLAVPGPT
jgi:signal transduction histidine kinase